MEILTKEDYIKNYKCKKYAQKAVNYLENKNILPLKPTPKLASIVGHLIGDGNLCKDLYVGNFYFFGTEEKLRNIETKVNKIFKIKPIYFYKRTGGYVLRYNNCMIARLLSLIGVPRGEKTIIKFGVPRWIINGEKEIKKAFLVALCDDEMSSPRLNKKGNSSVK